MNGHPNSQGVESQPQATLCSNGCGFWANVGTSGLCSKCYREAEQSKQTVDAVAAAVTRGQPSTSVAVASSSPESAEAQPAVPAVAAHPAPAETEAAAAPTQQTATPSPPPSTSSKCNVETCRKKLGLTGFKCRCGHSFCGQHRHAECHNCTFDWKALGRLKIADNNPLVQAAKIQKI